MKDDMREYVVLWRPVDWEELDDPKWHTLAAAYTDGNQAIEDAETYIATDPDFEWRAAVRIIPEWTFLS